MSVELDKQLYSGLAMVSLLLVTAHAGPPQPSATMQNTSQVRCTEIAVLGAVRNPIHFEARSGVRIVDALTHAGGPSERAGKTIRVIHSCKCGRCGESDGKADRVDEYNLAEVIRHNAKNAYVFPGDLVFVLESELVYVIGGTQKLTYIIWTERLSVTKAIALVGGARSLSDLTTIRINRVSKNAYQDPIVLNLKAIKEGRAEDVLLQPRDFVTVADGEGSASSLLIGHPQVIRDPPLIPREYRVICNMPQFKDLQAEVCRFVQ
jgi:protein involved in polysaccharide export with SLBB domain